MHVLRKFLGLAVLTLGAIVAGPAAAGGDAHVLLEIDFKAYWQDVRESSPHIAPAADRRAADERRIRDETIALLRRRLEAVTGADVSVGAEGADRIAIVLHGYSDLAMLKRFFADAPDLTLNLVDDDAPQADLAKGIAPAGERAVPQDPAAEGRARYLAIKSEPILTGRRIVWAQSGLDDRSGEPIVTVQFDAAGQAAIAAATRANLMHRMAIVVGGRVISAPMIVEPVTGGSVQITGGFTQEQAMDLAVRLMPSSIPAPLHLVEIGAGPPPQ